MIDIKTSQMRRVHAERGNAATITLLALAVAILVGVAVLYFAGRVRPEQVQPIERLRETATSTNGVAEENPRANWQTYRNSEYEFSIAFPPNWIVATGTVGLDPVVTVAPGVIESDERFDYHTAPTRITIYPLGLTGEGLFEEEYQSTVIVTVPKATARDYRLSSKRPWATQVRFEQYPSSWNEYGYIFARAQVEDESFVYYRGEDVIGKEEFDPFVGDRAMREGYVDPVTRALEEEILRSFHFEQSTGLQNGQEQEDIQVDAPHAGASVTSPLRVAGRARGTWYFEGSFPVRIETAAGTVLAELPATAEGDWMTTDHVPFELTVAFATTTATSGVVVLVKDNPSGLPEHDAEIRIPIVFRNESLE